MGEHSRDPPPIDLTPDREGRAGIGEIDLTPDDEPGGDHPSETIADLCDDPGAECPDP